MMKEKWALIKGYESTYTVSNKGRVQNIKTGRVLKAGVNGSGYKSISLCDGKNTSFKIHLLVFDAFGIAKRKGRILQVDHIDNDKLNNRIDNLQLLSNRANVSKCQFPQNRSSQYTGVYWNKKAQKWLSQIRIGKRRKYLGLFDDEQKASFAYQKELQAIF